MTARKRIEPKAKPATVPPALSATTKEQSSKWPAYTVEKWKISRLKPYEKNARAHSEKQIEQLRASMREYGWTIPILAREDGTIIAGHGRVEAAKLEGVTEVPVIVAAGWTELQCRSYTLADNKLAENSRWDEGMLAIEVGELKMLNVNLPLLGFSERETDRLLPVSDGKPGLGEVTYEAAFQVLIECKDEAEQVAILTRLQKDGVKCRALIA
jgi:hypothetical protein